MTCEMCVNFGFYEMVRSGKPYGYSGIIPCFTCKRYCNLSDKFVSKDKDYCTCDIPEAINTCFICKKLIKQ